MDRKAELYNNPGARFVGTGKLLEVLAQYDRLSADEKPRHFIKCDGKSYSGTEIETLKSR